MLFLGPVYRYVQAQLEGRINHWPLVRLIMYSLDKTLLYLALFLLLRLGLKLLFHRRFDAWHEVKVILFSAYVILLLMLTVFRQWYYPWQLHFYWERPLSAINWTPLVNTFKLRLGSQIDLWYQSFGNVLWFIPFGFGLPSLRRTKIAAWRAGACCYPWPLNRSSSFSLLGWQTSMMSSLIRLVPSSALACGACCHRGAASVDLI